MGFFGPALAAAVMNAVVVAPVVNMYSRAGEEADVVSQAIFGVNVGVLEQRDGWAKIRTPDAYTGWASLTQLALSERPYADAGRVAHVESLFAHVYREPSVVQHRPLLTLPFEARLETVGEGEEGWLRVRLPDERSGWMQRGDLTFDPKPASVDETIALARRFLGLPYTWGGTSSYGYDCSGFTQMLCRRRGVHIPRDARPQAEWSGVSAVEKEDLQPGDLVYFGKAPEKKITHTGMYIGGGEFIHATAHEKPVVQISRLDDPHWTEVYAAARRLK
jgi:hypothetical protein